MAKVSLVEYFDESSSPWLADDDGWFMPHDDYVIGIGPDGAVVRFKDNTWFLYNRGIAVNKKNQISVVYKESACRRKHRLT